MKGVHPSCVSEVVRILKEKDIEIILNARVTEVFDDGVQLSDGRKINANVPVWATGAEP